MNTSIETRCLICSGSQDIAAVATWRRPGLPPISYAVCRTCLSLYTPDTLALLAGRRLTGRGVA